MSNYYGPKIVTDGLVLCLDAASSKSYPGSGSAWFDLSANSADCSLINSPTYITNNSFSFDGIDEYGSITNIPTRSNTVTHEVWVRPTSLTGGEGGRSCLIKPQGTNTLSDTHCYIMSNGSVETSLRNSTDNGYEIYSTAANLIAINNWYHIIQTVNRPAGNVRIYINSVLRANNGTSTHNMSYTGNAQIAQQGTNIASIYARRLNGRIAIAKIYNKVLSASEILQNYNATKGRFGL